MITCLLLLATNAFAQTDLPSNAISRPRSSAPAGFAFPRQNNEFDYLCGVETPQSYLLLDAKSHRATLLPPPGDERLERSEGRVLSASDVEFVRRVTGADEVLSTSEMTVD